MLTVTLNYRSWTRLCCSTLRRGPRAQVHLCDIIHIWRSGYEIRDCLSTEDETGLL